MQQDGKQIDDVWVQTGLQQPLVLTRTEKKLVRSEEHTSELQSQSNLVCRLLLEKKNLEIRLLPFVLDRLLTFVVHRDERQLVGFLELEQLRDVRAQTVVPLRDDSAAVQQVRKLA